MIQIKIGSLLDCWGIIYTEKQLIKLEKSLCTLIQEHINESITCFQQNLSQKIIIPNNLTDQEEIVNIGMKNQELRLEKNDNGPILQKKNHQRIKSQIDLDIIEKDVCLTSTSIDSAENNRFDWSLEESKSYEVKFCSMGIEIDEKEDDSERPEKEENYLEKSDQLRLNPVLEYLAEHNYSKILITENEEKAEKTTFDKERHHSSPQRGNIALQGKGSFFSKGHFIVV